MKNIKSIIKSTNENNQNKINLTKAWSQKYPVIKEYQNKIDIKKYKDKINELLHSLENDYEYSKLDAMLVLKDILYQEYKNKK